MAQFLHSIFELSKSNDPAALLEFFMTVGSNHAKIWQNDDKITVNSTDLLSDFIKIDSNSPTVRSTMRKIDNSFEVNC